MKSPNKQSGKVERVTDGGNLLENLALIEPQSWQTSQEVFADWKAGAPVEGVNTANLAVYRLVEREPVLDLLAREGNLFLDDRFRKGAYNGISNQEFFIPSGDMLEHLMSVIRKGKAVEVPYSGLKVRTGDFGENYGFVKVNAKNKPDEKKLIRGVYGIENPGNGKKIHLLRPEIVKRELIDNRYGVVVRACYFGNDQDFNADDKYIDYVNYAVRGVRRDLVAEGDARRKFDDAYKYIIGNPDMLKSSQAGGLINLTIKYAGTHE